MDSWSMDRKLSKAIRNGCIKEVKWLVNQGADVSYFKHRPVWIAAQEIQIEIFDYLMKEVLRKAQLDGYKEYEKEMSDS